MILRTVIDALLGANPPPVCETLRLEDAVLCVDCETLSPARGDFCVACGSRALLNLKRVLGGIRREGSARLVRIDDWWARFNSMSRALGKSRRETAGRKVRPDQAATVRPSAPPEPHVEREVLHRRAA